MSFREFHNADPKVLDRSDHFHKPAEVHRLGDIAIGIIVVSGDQQPHNRGKILKKCGAAPTPATQHLPYHSHPGIPIGAPGGISIAGWPWNFPGDFSNSAICCKPSNNAPFHLPLATLSCPCIQDRSPSTSTSASARTLSALPAASASNRFNVRSSTSNCNSPP